MSFNNKLIVFYPNVVNYNTSDLDAGLNYDPSAKPSITGEDYTSSGGETSGPAYDLVDNKVGSVVTINTNAQNTNVIIDYGLSSSVTIDTLIIGNHNVADVEFAILIKYGGGPTTATVNSAYSGARAITGEWRGTACTVTTNEIQVDTANGTLIANMDSFSSTTPYLDVTPQGANYAAYDATIGEVSFCQSWTAPNAPETNGWEEVDEYGNMISDSTGGQKYGTFLHGNRKRISFMFENMPQANYDALKTLERITKGPTYPMWVDLGEHATLPYLRFMRLMNLRATRLAGGLFLNVSVTLEEE